MKKAIADLRIVTIGGGTGGFTVNSGLKQYPVHPTAICTVFDSGGSTGVLRDEFGALPQGDIRRCILALIDDKDHRWRTLFNHRFSNSNGTSGISKHSFGNLMLLAGESEWGRVEGIRTICEMLNVRGGVLPISIDNAHLCARLCDGSIVEGESKIDTRDLADERTITKVWLEPNAFICREAHEAILAADVVVFGPGDLYTSIIPNLLVKGVQDALACSKAKLVYVSNLMTKWQETRGFSAVQFVEAICSYGVGRDKFDAVFVNNASIPEHLIKLYAQNDKSTSVTFDADEEKKLLAFAKRVIPADFLNKNGVYQLLVRHDSATLAKCIIELASEG
jgi:uncharacterized cofD-like protein